MFCAVYKGRRRPDTYLYLDREDDFTRVPGSLLELLGPLELVMTFELHAGRRLARADNIEVMHQLRDRGWFLQLPPDPDERRDAGR